MFEATGVPGPKYGGGLGVKQQETPQAFSGRSLNLEKTKRPPTGTRDSIGLKD